MDGAAKSRAGPATGLGPRTGRGEKKTGRARGERQTRARCRAAEENKAGPGCWAETEEERKSLSFFLFQIFKAFFKKILNPLLNLIQTTQYKNSNAAA
jgi:hypothetical protein